MQLDNNSGWSLSSWTKPKDQVSKNVGSKPSGWLVVVISCAKWGNCGFSGIWMFEYLNIWINFQWLQWSDCFKEYSRRWVYAWLIAPKVRLNGWTTLFHLGIFLLNPQSWWKPSPCWRMAGRCLTGKGWKRSARRTWQPPQKQVGF